MRAYIHWVSHLLCVTSVQFSRSVVSDSLRPHEPQHASPPCPSPTPRVHPNPCPLSRWCHPTISSSVIPFSSCPQSFPASGSFQMSQLFASGGQSIGVSASTPLRGPLFSFTVAPCVNSIVSVPLEGKSKVVCSRWTGMLGELGYESSPCSCIFTY